MSAFSIRAAMRELAALESLSAMLGKASFRFASDPALVQVVGPERVGVVEFLLAIFTTSIASVFPQRGHRPICERIGALYSMPLLGVVVFRELLGRVHLREPRRSNDSGCRAIWRCNFLAHQHSSCRRAVVVASSGTSHD